MAAAAAARQRDKMAVPPSAIASAIEQPAGVDSGEVVVRPTAQA